jgi:hypothetical protein
MKYILLLLISTSLFSKTVIIEMNYVGDKYNIINSKIIEEDYPNNKASFTSKDTVYFKIKNKKNEIIEVVSINNPRILTIPPSEYKNDSKNIKPIIKKSGSFLIRFKYNENISKIEITDEKNSQTLPFTTILEDK